MPYLAEIWLLKGQIPKSPSGNETWNETVHNALKRTTVLFLLQNFQKLFRLVEILLLQEKSIWIIYFS